MFLVLSDELVQLRLQGPLHSNGTGRVEVFYYGQWGTICNNGWDMRDARVVCRQLGYVNALRTLPMFQFPYSSGRIWLDNVGCTGRERNITSCSHGPWGNNYCRHYEDVGVECGSEGKTNKNIDRLKCTCYSYCLVAEAC